MHTIGDGSTLLDLLREAGDEAVTFEELELVGITDPARALWELELSGFHVQRVFDERKLCVRLMTEAPRFFEDAPPEEDVALAHEIDTTEFAAVAPAEMPPAPAAVAIAPGSSPARRSAAVALLALLLLALVARRR